MGTTLEFEKIYTTDQAAEVLQVNVQTLRKWIRQGRITVSRLGNDYRITGSDLEAFLDDTRVN